MPDTTFFTTIPSVVVKVSSYAFTVVGITNNKETIKATKISINLLFFSLFLKV